MGRGKQVTLHFKRCGLKKYGKMIRGKQVTLYFKRCYLKKYGKMIRGKQITLHFKCCILNVAVWKNTGKWNILITSSTWKTSNIAFQMLQFGKVRKNDTRKTNNAAFQSLYFKCYGLKKYGKMICGKQITLHFKCCILSVVVWKNMGKWNIFITSSTRKTSNVAFQTLRFEKYWQIVICERSYNEICKLHCL